jgi:hypothetical protein
MNMKLPDMKVIEKNPGKNIIVVGVIAIAFYLAYMYYTTGINTGEYIYTFLTTKHKINNPYISPITKPTCIIPKKLFQTWHTKKVPPHMQKAIDSIQKCNPELEYFLFDDNDCIEFIKTHFDAEVEDAYNKLLPGAYKADLWRYCVMYIHGGVYIDIKYQCMNGFKFIDIMDKEHLVLERPDYSENYIYGIYNGVIISKPENPLFLDCIKHIVHNVNTRYYGKNSLAPTGPGLLGGLYFGDIDKNINKIHEFDLFFNLVDQEDSIIYNNQIILQSYPEYRREQLNNQNKYHYGQLWEQRNIYA